MAAEPRILVAESGGFSSRAAEILRSIGIVELAELSYLELLEAVAEVEVLWVRLRSYIGTEVMDAAPRLRLIATATTGLNHVDLEEAERRGIGVLSLRGEAEFLKDIRATAEHTVALLLSLLRDLPAAVEHVRSGGWDRDRFRGREIYGKTVGIVGYGRLGRIVARYLRAFDARVLVADPFVRADALGEDLALVPLEQLFAEADVVSLHVSYTAETAGLIDADALGRMRPGTWLVNTSRGELVDEAALLEALRRGHLGGAALDVLSNEHRGVPGDHPLVAYARDHANLLITPHIGGSTIESMARTEEFLADRIVDWCEAASSRSSKTGGVNPGGSRRAQR